MKVEGKKTESKIWGTEKSLAENEGKEETDLCEMQEKKEEDIRYLNVIASSTN